MMSIVPVDEKGNITLVGRVGMAIEEAIEDWPDESVAKGLLFSQRQKVAIAAVDAVIRYLAEAGNAAKRKS